MKTYSTLITAALLVSSFFAISPVLGQTTVTGPAPVTLQGIYIVPRTSGNVMGSSTTYSLWKTATTTTLCIGSDCRTAWPAGGSGTTTTIAGAGTATGPAFTFATSTDTNMGIGIACSSATCTFTPVWIGTLADGRITSAANWNAKLTSPLSTKGDLLAHSGAANIRFPVGSDGKVLVSSSTATNGISWETIGAGTPGGSNTQIQFNDSSSFGGDSSLTWNKTTNLLTVEKISAVQDVAFTVSTPDGTGDLLRNMTFTAGSGSSGNNQGGSIAFTAGNGIGTRTGGGLTFTSGVGGTSDGQGGAVTINAADAGGGNANGGGVYITAGAKSGSGANGGILLDSLDSGLYAILDTSAVVSSNKTFSFPNQTGTFALTQTMRYPIQWIIENPTASENDAIFTFRATSTVSSCNAVNKSLGDTITFGLGYSTSRATATSSLTQLLNATTTTVTATTTPVTLTLSSTSTQPGLLNPLIFYTTAASSSQFTLTCFYAEN